MKSKSRTPKKPSNFLVSAVIFFVIFEVIEFVFDDFNTVSIAGGLIGAIIYYFVIVYLSKRK